MESWCIVVNVAEAFSAQNMLFDWFSDICNNSGESQSSSYWTDWSSEKDGHPGIVPWRVVENRSQEDAGRAALHSDRHLGFRHSSAAESRDSLPNLFISVDLVSSVV